MGLARLKLLHPRQPLLLAKLAPNPARPGGNWRIISAKTLGWRKAPAWSITFASSDRYQRCLPRTYRDRNASLNMASVDYKEISAIARKRRDAVLSSFY